jgi:hypothetical protein
MPLRDRLFLGRGQSWDEWRGECTYIFVIVVFEGQVNKLSLKVKVSVYGSLVH